VSQPDASQIQSRTRFDPAEVEPRIVERWLASGIFHPVPEGTAAENYSIAIPPPNVTGSLHMGHALNGSIQDALVRYQRMRGRRTKWILGTDHAGIATQTQVEREARALGTSREQLGREAFIARVWAWRERYGHQIIEQYKRLGASCDYADERFTLDERYAQAVVKVFVALYDKGLIYRDRYIVNWDPGSGSAISDLEVEEREQIDTLYSIVYDLDGGGSVTIATVRPETMLADTALAVNPHDERHAGLIGRHAILPLVGRRLPIIADDYVKPEFGTGVLKVTPAHDPNDFEIGQRHGLEQVQVIGEDGRLTAEAGERFAGLTVMEGRAAVVQALELENRIVAREQYRHEVPFSHRSGERIEPLISLQWFMRMEELAAPAIEVVRAGRIRITPEGQRRRYLEWLEGIRPWCISRQLWWGHRLPVWYCDACEETIVATSAPARCGACNGELRRDEDVLDTWFSSALWPFATLGWPEQTPELRAFYPTDVLVTARDIIFLWVARMVMMGLEFTGEVPFETVYVHSVIHAPDGRRMSKSLGTGIDPVELIDAHGADAVRFGLLAMSSTQDVKFSAEKIEQGQALAIKLFSAVRFALLKADPAATPAARPLTVEDRWILSRLERLKLATAARLESFDFAHLASGLYDFVYGELCDWYVELVKERLDGPDRKELSATLLLVLRETLALAHPVIPFVTEELWSLCGGEGLLAAGPWPQPRPDAIDEPAEQQLARAIDAIKALRAWRDGAGLRPSAPVRGRLQASGYDELRGAIARLARMELVDDRAADGRTAIASVAVPGGTVELLDAEGFDPNAAATRRERDRERLLAEIARAQGKLDNAGFVAKAPPALVSAEREKLAELREELSAL
jgi:valyl-tRNA synthetase